MEKNTSIRTFKNISVFLFALVLSVSSCARKTNITTAVTHDSQVPESEMVYIIFSLNWILTNDIDPDPYTVKITFPVSWLTEAPALLDSDIPIELSVPRQLLNDHNESNDPGLITVVFPNKYFKGLPIPPEIPSGASSPQLIIYPHDTNFFTMPDINPPPEEIKISAISGPLEWYLTSEASWLILSKTHGTATAEEETITVSIDTTGFGIGSYSTVMLLTNANDGSIRDLPVRIFITTVQEGQIPEATFENNFGDELAEGIILEQAAVAFDILSRSGEVVHRFELYNAGDLCLVIKGKMRNTSEKDLLVNFFAVGYDEDGNEVSWTLDVEPGPISGIANIDVPSQSVVDFTLHLSWAENVKVIKITGNSSPYPFGYSPDEPTTTSP